MSCFRSWLVLLGILVAGGCSLAAQQLFFSTKEPAFGSIATLPSGAFYPSVAGKLYASWGSQELSQPPDGSSPMMQGRGQRGARGGAGGGGRPGGGRTPGFDRSDYPMWEIEGAFQKDVFTFVRIEYDSMGGFGGGGGWRNDFPDCDLNFSGRLQQLTSMKVDPEAKYLRLTDPKLFEYPFIFMTNSGDMFLSTEEKACLRKYLLNGGFLMSDDFWAARSWQHIREVIKSVFPERELKELTLDHEIFHMVYDLNKLPQVPSIRAWSRGLTYEDWHGPYEGGDTSPHFWGLYDDNQRMMAIFCHNNDIADGWEREGEEVEFFQQYSMKCSYPFGINIITYAMSH